MYGEVWVVQSHLKNISREIVLELRYGTVWYGTVLITTVIKLFDVQYSNLLPCFQFQKNEFGTVAVQLYKDRF